MSVLLDTHVWIWWLTGNAHLPSKDRSALDRIAFDQVPAISAISLWEAQMLVAKGRIIPEEPFSRWIRRMSAPDVVRLLPLDPDVIVALAELPASFHGDPADRLIVATSRAHDLPVSTYDRTIRRSHLVRLWSPTTLPETRPRRS